MTVARALLRIFVGLVFGIAGALALAPAFAAFTRGPDDAGSAIIWVVVLLGVALAFFAPSIRRAFGRGFLLLGAAVFALPLSMMMLSGRVTSDMVAGADAGNQAMTALGAGVAGIVTTGLAAFVGFFLGAIFLIMGLVLSLGGRREVVVVSPVSQQRIDPLACVLAGVLSLGATDALSQESREGWGLQFRQDTFDKTVFPVAMLSQDGDGFDKALIAFACGENGQLASFFQPERFMMFAEASKAQFRAADQNAEFTFAIGDIPNMGRRLVVSPDDAGRIATLFENADGADVSFRTDKKQGTFTSIGARETLAIMRQHCA